MIRLENPVLKEIVEIERIIGHFKGQKPGPTLIFTGGIHGNEPSGVFALHTVLEELNTYSEGLSGSLYAITGNMSALENGVRYNTMDLNRLWTEEQIASIENNTVITTNADVNEQIEIYNVIKSILATERGPFYFFDLHTTSSITQPFLTINDSLMNRQFTNQYPLLTVLGIEEYLDGPLLSYINKLGYIAFGFEAGQHESPASYQNHLSFIYLSMGFAGFLPATSAIFKRHYKELTDASQFKNSFYEIIYRYELDGNSNFSMRNGYTNFQNVKKNEIVALNNEQVVRNPKAGKIFMPLYQGKGNDGFFVIRRIPKIFLNISSFLRRISFDRFLVLLPGIKWTNDKHEELIVNQKVARFFSKQLFHLLGYRSKRRDHKHLIMNNRERNSRTYPYSNLQN